MSSSDDVAGVAAPTPRVVELSWGSVQTEAGAFRDAKLWPGGGRAWDWNETGTHHSPGVQVADVQEVLDNGAGIVVLSRGQQGRLEVPEGTLEALRDLDVEVEVHDTRAAVERVNDLVEQGRAVGALLHSTC